jgi:hypothetical protein
LFLFFLIVNLIHKKGPVQKDINDIEYYFSQLLCQLFSFPINYKCSVNFFNNDNLFLDVLEINCNINLILNLRKSKLENIFLLLSIIPFLKNNSTLSYKINDKGIYKFFKKIFKKRIKYKIIKLDYNDLYLFNKKMKELLNYEWEYIPKQLILNNFRYIINNYYNETNLDSFQNTLNINYKSYINNKINEITYEEIDNLLSKLIILINFIYKKENIGIYEKDKCIGIGSTGRVCI